MELAPQTERGRQLFSVLTNWIEKSPQYVVDKLKRIFLMKSLEMEKGDEFITVLYGQSVLDDSPSVLSQRFPTALLRVQHAMETAVSKMCVKELFVALELSGNDSVLTGIQKWTEGNSKEIAEAIQRLSTDLAPVRVQKPQRLSEIVPRTVGPRIREISAEAEDKCCTTVDVCKDKIIVGWKNGQIGIHSDTDLHCETVLPHYMNMSEVTCLQCTCTEIIAGYRDGKICVWNIEKGFKAHQFSIRKEDGYDPVHPSSMRWKDPKLVVCTSKGKVKIWQYCSSSFTLLHTWDADKGGIRHVDLNEKYVILQHYYAVDINCFNGRHICSISNPKVNCVALDGNHLITGGDDRIVRIWSISTGACLKELKGHDCPIRAVSAHGGAFATSDSKGEIIIWNLKAELEGIQAELVYSAHPKCDAVPLLKLGQKVVVTAFTAKQAIQVTDFLV